MADINIRTNLIVPLDPAKPDQNDLQPNQADTATLPTPSAVPPRAPLYRK
jgi:hypothetical protein